MSRSIDYQGLAVLENAGSAQTVDITVHVAPADVDAEETPTAIEVSLREDLIDLLAETAKVTILARTPVGVKVVTGFRLLMVDRAYPFVAAASDDRLQAAEPSSAI